MWVAEQELGRMVKNKHKNKQRATENRIVESHYFPHPEETQHEKEELQLQTKDCVTFCHHWVGNEYLFYFTPIKFQNISLGKMRHWSKMSNSQLPIYVMLREREREQLALYVNMLVPSANKKEK